MSTQNRTITIAQSASLSDAVPIGNVDSIGLIVPSITSCQVFLQGGSDTTSVNAKRIMDADGAATWSADVGAGSLSVPITTIAKGFSHIRIETSVAQNSAQSFVLTTKF